MDIYVKKLQKQLDTALNKIDTSKDPINGYFKRMQTVREFRKRLKRYIRQMPAPDRAAELYYFRHVLPFFYSRLYYNAMLYSLEISRKAEDKAGFIKFMEHQLERAKFYLLRHEYMHRYIHSNRGFWDHTIFSDGSLKGDKAKLFPEGSGIVSKIMAYERFRDFLEAEIDLLNNPMPVNTAQWEGRVYTWEGKDSDIVEVIYGLFGTNAVKVNGRKMTIKDYKTMCRDFFGIELGNVYDTKSENLKRKIDPVRFLNSMIQAVIKKK